MNLSTQRCIIACILLVITPSGVAGQGSTTGAAYRVPPTFRYYATFYWVFAIFCSLGVVALLYFMPVRLYRALVVYVLRFPAIHKKAQTSGHLPPMKPRNSAESEYATESTRPSVSVLPVLDPHDARSDPTSDDGDDVTPSGYKPQLVSVFGVPVDLALRHPWLRCASKADPQESPFKDRYWMTLYVSHLISFMFVFTWCAFFNLSILSVRVHYLHDGDYCPTYVVPDWDCYWLESIFVGGQSVDCATYQVTPDSHKVNGYLMLQCWKWIGTDSEILIAAFSTCAALLTLVLGGLVAIISQVLLKVTNINHLRIIHLVVVLSIPPLLYAGASNGHSMLSIYLPALTVGVAAYTVALRYRALQWQNIQAAAQQSDLEQQSTRVNNDREPRLTMSAAPSVIRKSVNQDAAYDVDDHDMDPHSVVASSMMHDTVPASFEMATSSSTL